MIPEQKAWELVWRHRRFWFLHFAISLGLAVLIVGWFWIPESSAVTVATSLAGVNLSGTFRDRPSTPSRAIRSISGVRAA